MPPNLPKKGADTAFMNLLIGLTLIEEKIDGGKWLSVNLLSKLQQGMMQNFLIRKMHSTKGKYRKFHSDTFSLYW